MPKSLAELDPVNREALRQAHEAPVRSLGIKELRAQTPYNGFVDCRIGPWSFLMLLVNGDDGVALRWLWNRIYEGCTLSLWAQLAKRSQFIYDIGAHTGVYTILARLANPNATSIGFEPNMINFARLRTNLRANDIDPGDVYNLAISDIEGTVPFSIPAQTWYHSSGGTVGERPGVPAVPVTAFSVDSLIRRRPHRLDLVKIDTEGHEGRVLSGMQNTLAGKPDLIIESVHQASASQCTATLEALGYTFYVIDEGQKRLSGVMDLLPLQVDGKPDHSRINRLASVRPREEIKQICGEAGLTLH